MIIRTSVGRGIARALVFSLLLQGWPVAAPPARVFLPSAAVEAAAFTLFGPRDYVRGNGAPVEATATLPGDPAGSFVLRIENRGSAGHYDPVTSAVVTLNGVIVVAPYEFNPGVDVIEKSVPLAAANTLVVELRGKPGSGFTLRIDGDDATNQPPTARAGSDQTAGLGDLVQLDGSGSSDPDGDALSYAWSFAQRPAGSSAMLSNPSSVQPTFTVDVPGTYRLALVVNDGSVDSAPDEVVVTTTNSAPSAAAGPDQTVAVGDVVTLDGSGSSDTDGDALTYSWTLVSLPPGSAAALSDPTAVHPTFVADRSGTYVARLVVNDGQADSAPDTVSIATSNSVPVANAGPDQTALVGATVTLDGSGSHDVDGNALTFQWALISVPAGSTASLSNPSQVSPTFTVDEPGTYVAQLIVNDGMANSAPDTVSITTINSPPVANAGPDQSVFVGTQVMLDGSGSQDVDGDSLTFTWSLVSVPAGSSAALSDPSAVGPQFTVDVPGDYIAQLTVNDGTAASTDTVIISTQNSAPVANAGSDQTTVVGAMVTLNGSGSHDADGDALTFQWSFLSRPAGSTASLSNPSAVQPTFDVDRFGTYVIQLIVNDGTADSAADTVTITTLNSPPTADAGPSQSVFVGTNVMLDGSGSSDVDGNALTFQWSLTSVPAGSTASLSNPSAVSPTFTVDLPGTYVAQLIVNDGTVNSAPDTVSITTTNSAPVANAGLDQTVLVGADVTLDGSSSLDADGNGLTYFWAFTSRPVDSNAVLSAPTAVSPAFTVDRPGTYVLQLVVNDGTVDSTPDAVVITTTNSAPVANAGPDQSTTVGETVTLDGTGSHDADFDALTYQWALTVRPAGSAAAISDPAAAMPTFVADLAGTYVAQLIVNDGTVNSAPDTMVVTTANRPPVASAGADQFVLAGETVLLDGSGSSDPDGDALTHLWSLDVRPAGSLAALADPTAQNPTFVADRGGEYVVRLVVDDGLENSAPDTVTVTARVLVPDVEGAAQADAEAAITNAQLMVGAITMEYSDTVPVDHVITQSPVAGASADVGSAVDLVVSRGPAPVEVPGVVGQPQAAAEAAIVAAQLVVGTVAMQNSDAVPAGFVISQDPVADTLVPRGSAVNLVVSLGGSAPVLTAITVTPANPTLARGLNQQFVATGTFSNGSTQDITAGVMWESTAPLIAALNAAGLAGALDTGVATIRATKDGITGTTTLTVTPPAQASIVVTPPNPILLVGQTQTFSATAVLADGTSQSLAGLATWASDSAAVTIDPASGFATAALPGPATISATGNGVTGTTTVTVQATIADGTAPTAAITAPANNALLTTQVNVLGTATDANFSRYVLDYAPAGATSFTTITTGTTPVAAGGVLGSFDPSVLINDLYTLRLRVFDRGNNVTTASINVQVTRDQKVGLFTLTFEDVSVPMVGIPMMLLRVYDSRDKAVGDFGFGWRLDLRSLRARTNRLQGTGWQVSVSGGFIPAYTLSGTDQHKVTVTLPDGKVEEFDMTVTPSSQPLIPLQFVTASYTPRAGTLGSLRHLGSNSLFVNGSQPGVVELLDDGTFETFDPRLFEYTTKDGGVIVVDRITGVQSVRDLNGNSLTIGAAGMTHSGGLGIAFMRDGLGRITSITDPNGNIHRYAYDANGDLATYTDPLGFVTRFFYNLSHGLIELRDARGLYPTRNEYDADGRLVATIDAAGNRIELTHNLGARSEVIRDRRGNATVYNYDVNGNVLSSTNALNQTTTFTYDARGNELTKTNDAGQTITKTYDARDNVLTERDALNRTITRTYNARGQILTETDRNGNVATSTYDANGNLLTYRDFAGRLSTQTYDARGNRLTATDPAGRVSTSTYDGSGRRLTAVDTLGNTTRYTYDSNGNRLTDVVTVTDETGAPLPLTSRRQFDAKNKLIADIDPAGGATRFEYNAIGKASAFVDKDGHRVTFEYDARGNRTRSVFPDGTTETMVYDAENNLTQWTDRAGRLTAFTYDALNRLTRTTYADGSATSEEYDNAGRKTAIVDERGGRTVFEYDAAGQRTAEVDPLGNRTTYTYNGVGKVLTKTDANSRVTRYEYDGMSRLTRTIYPDTSAATVTYDALGRKSTETDQAGRTKTYEYDNAGRLTAVVDNAGGRTEYTYDAAGNRLTQRDARGNVTRFAYDAAGRMVRRTLPLGMSETAAFDAQGNQLTRTDFMGRQTSYTYTVNNLPASLSYPDGTGVTYAYTPLGKRSSVTDARGVTTYTYDLRDRLTRMVDPDGTEVSYAYDAHGNITGVTTPSGTTVSAYDAANRLTTVTEPDGGMTTYSYDAVGNRTATTLPNGTQTVYTYDTLNRLTGLEQRTGAGAVLASYTYTLNAAGQRTLVTELSGRSVSYAYDGLARLTSETITDPVAGNTTIVYTYDAVGNRLTKTEGASNTQYIYDANDRLLDENGMVFLYDANGNMVRKTAAATTTHYIYDFENRLVRKDIPGTTTYVYDADGVRMQQTVDGAVTNFVVDRNRDLPEVLEERNAAGALQVSYVYGDDLISQTRGATTAYYHFDGSGSTRLLTDAAQAVTDTYTFDAFGVQLASTGATPNRYLFNGQQYDADTAFYYLRARYYNARQGRFLTMDSFQGVETDPPSLHKYVYAHNDPVNMSDPSGLFAMASMAISMPMPITITINFAAILAFVKTVVVVLAAACGASLALSTVTAFQGPDPCNVRGKANMFYPAGDTPQTTRHISDAISFGHKALLHRGPRINWNYRATPACAGNIALLSGLWCDEYPFATSKEGGPGSSTRLVPAGEQMLQGGYLAAFYGACAITTTAPDDAYAVGPVPISPQTLWVCKN